ncbi:MAG: hypothetical protein GJ680_14165 [Alteromonadaceae bacterium]|nr:hypothetical protein [Alteromonadaceae bacterium]
MNTAKHRVARSLVKYLAQLSLVGAATMSMTWSALASAEQTLTIVPERSKGLVNVAQSNKLEANASVTMQAKGRLWAVQQGAESDYNVICMNQSTSSLEVINSNAEMPWLAPNSSHSCGRPKSNVYSCHDSNAKPALICRTQQVAKTTSGGGITDMTAVALRSVDMSDDTFFRIADQIMAEHQIHFDLCSDLHGEHERGGIAFTIQAEGDINNIEIITDGELATPSESKAYAQCVAQAIELWQFPSLDYIYEMEYSFAN